MPPPRKGLEQATMVLTPRSFGCGHTHVGRGDVSIASGGCVAAHHIDRDDALPSSHAGVQLHTEVLYGVFLGQGKVMHLLDSEIDIHPDTGGHVFDAFLDFVFRHDDLARPFIQLQGIVAHGVFTAFQDFGQHFVDHFLRRGGFRFRSLACSFQVGDSHVLPLGC